MELKSPISRRFLNNLVLLFLRFRHNYTTMFPLDLSTIMYMQWRVFFQDHVPQRWEVYNLWIFIIQGYTFHFAFSCTSICLRAIYRKYIVLGATRYKLFEVGARAKLLQLFGEVGQIIPVPLSRFIHFLNVDNRVCITLQDRISQITQVFVV